jgi:hypothetical protein
MYDPYLHAARVVVRHASTAIAIAAIAGVAACSDSTNVRTNGASQLGFSTASTTTVAGASLAEVPITKNGHTLDLK